MHANFVKPVGKAIDHIDGGDVRSDEHRDTRCLENGGPEQPRHLGPRKPGQGAQAEYTEHAGAFLRRGRQDRFAGLSFPPF